ncbi:MAG: ring-cleaving dioxygenase [Bacillota bacterium]
MNPSILGIHHVTAITADAQKNIDFYCGVLGLRLVKLTVNFDDPGSYHLYYGDDLGHPGTILTFFAWADAYRGRIGPPQVTTTAFAVSPGAYAYWADRLREHGVPLQASSTRLGEQVLSFADPDGLQVEIVATTTSEGTVAAGGAVPPEYAIRGFHGVTLAEEGYENTATLLTEVMGFRAVGHEGNRFRYRASGNGNLATVVDLLCVPDARRGSLGAGVVHHVAFRTPDDAQQETWRQKIVHLGYNVSPVMDRNYFHSIYYREPGGVLFEIATDPPGFTVDQNAEELGTRLMLPSWLEPYRAQLEQVLPPLRLPSRHAEARG